MALDNSKYMVFKSDKFDDWFNDLGATDKMEMGPGDFAAITLDDAVVIRPQDIFAGPGLHAYAASIQTFIEAYRVIVPMDLGDTRYLQRLFELRDFFEEQATIADNHPNKKVPD